MTHTVSLPAAITIAQAALAAAEQKGLRTISVVIVDHAAAVRVAMRCEDASLFGVEIAKAKAISAMAFRTPTLSQAETLGKNAALVAAVVAASDGRFMPIGGGRPILLDGTLIGAAAVAGSTPAEDDSLIGAAIRAAGLSSGE